MNEQDSKTLDLILKVALEQGSATNKNLPPLNHEFLSDQPAIKNKEYSYYLEVIEEYKVAIVNRLKEGFDVEPIPIKTQRFVESGGFRRIYSESLKEKENTALKEKQESEIRILQVKELKGNIFQLRFWWLILLINVIISFLIAIITK